MCPYCKGTKCEVIEGNSAFDSFQVQVQRLQMEYCYNRIYKYCPIYQRIHGAPDDD